MNSIACERLQRASCYLVDFGFYIFCSEGLIHDVLLDLEQFLLPFGFALPVAVVLELQRLHFSLKFFSSVLALLYFSEKVVGLAVGLGQCLCAVESSTECFFQF